MSEKKRKIDSETFASAESTVIGPKVVWDINAQLAPPEEPPALTIEELFECEIQKLPVVRIFGNPTEYKEYRKQERASDIVQIVVGPLVVGVCYDGDGGWHEGEFSLSFSRGPWKAFLNFRNWSLTTPGGTNMVELFTVGESTAAACTSPKLARILALVSQKWIAFAIKVIRAEISVHVHEINAKWRALSKEDQQKVLDGDETEDDDHGVLAPLQAVETVLNSAIYKMKQ